MKVQFVVTTVLAMDRHVGWGAAGQSRLSRISLLSLTGLMLITSGNALGQLQQVDAIRTVAGIARSEGSAGDNGPARLATFAVPSGVAIDRAGNMFVADANNNKVREIAAVTGIITTIAGNGTAGFFGDGGPATSAELNLPINLAVDAAGNVYISDFSNHRIRKVTVATGEISTVAGNGIQGSSGDGGPATSANLSVYGITVDSGGALYIADGSARIRRVSASGVISTIAGTGTFGFAGDGGPASSAQLSAPEFVTVDSAGNVYVMDYGNMRIRKIASLTGVITTIAGNGATGASGDGGPAVNAAIDAGEGIAFSPGGDLYLAERNENVIRKVATATGIITTIAGTGAQGYSGDGGAATQAAMSNPINLTTDGAGNIFVAEQTNDVIREISPSTLFPTTAVNQAAAVQNVYLQTTSVQTISLFTAPRSLSGSQEYIVGQPSGCSLDPTVINPVGTVCTIPVTFKPAYPGQRPTPLQAFTSAGNLNIGLNGLATGPLAALTPGIIHTAAGTTGTAGYKGDGGPATSALLYSPSFATTDSSGNLYFIDYPGNCVVRKITATTGVISTIAGTTCVFSSSISSGSGNGGPATSAVLGTPNGIAVDSARNVYIADGFTIRKVEASTGIITSYAGTGTNGYSGDGGPAIAANLDQTTGLGIDSQDNLYLVSFANNVVREIKAASGIITTVAGDGTQGNSGDGGPATSAQLNTPQGVALDGSGNLLIADTGNLRIRKVAAATGVISKVAGNGQSGQSGDGGPATSAAIGNSFDITVDAAGNFYIPMLSVIRKVNGTSGTISTVAGVFRSTGGAQDAGDGGPATKATLNTLHVTIDAAGTLYAMDSNYSTIRDIPASPSQLIYNTVTNVGSADSTDDPQTAILSNVGNAPLTIATPTAGHNPAITAS